MKRAVVCVATTERYQRGMDRLFSALRKLEPGYVPYAFDRVREGWPSHSDKPYAFKAYALKAAADAGADLVLWADACILPVKSLEPLWERIERDGYWIATQMDPKTGEWNNAQWTADSAYPDLFPGLYKLEGSDEVKLAVARHDNKALPHVVATSFGLNVKSYIGNKFLAEYYRLASETRAFCGPWWNSNAEREDYRKNPGAAPCGPPSTLGHRHDQTAASVIAWRLGMKLTDPPEVFAYGKAGDKHDERTILVADGSYE